MTTLKETAQQYTAPTTLNVSELDKLPIDIEIKTANGTNKDGEEFTYYYVELDSKKYRIPVSVIAGIKTILTKIPHLKFVSVMKEGSGTNTRYQVIPLQ